MSQSPVILIYSGKPDNDEIYRAGIAQHFPELTILTANSAEQAREHLPQTEILFASWTFPVGEFLDVSQHVRWFQILGAGAERIAAGARFPGNVTITNAKGVFGPLMSEYALSYMFAHAQQIRQVVRNQDQHHWTFYAPGHLHGATVGVAGLGSVGRAVVERCNALGMRVIGLRRQSGDVEGVSEVYTFAEIDQFMPQCDFLVMVLPQTPETVGMFTRDHFRSLKSNCFLVNMGRGTVYREEDLIEALREGWLAGAALDVHPTEPLPEDSALWEMENVYITPHIAGINPPDKLVPQFVENIGRYLKGEPLLNQVDLDRGY